MAMRWEGTGDSSDNNNQHKQYLAWCHAFYKAYMDKGRRLEDSRNMRNINRSKRRNIKPAVTKISQTFTIIFERIKFLTARSSMSTPSPEVVETNESFERGGRSAAAAAAAASP
jgi:hypothetical protein